MEIASTAGNSHNNPLNCLCCNSAMHEPVRLPCQHNFCLGCVGSSECLICARPFNHNELVEDKVLKYVLDSSREAAEACANCDRRAQPMFFCETCQQPLCGKCREITHKAKIFSLHNIVQTEERGRLRNRPFCSTHNEPFILFCLESKSLMCIECFNSSSLERRGHFLNIDVAHKICRDKLEKSAANLRNFQSELREQFDLRRRLVMELEKNGEFLAKEINNKCDDIINRVNQLRNSLMEKMLATVAEKREVIEAQMNQFLHLENPMAVNLLSISIFCSYASKIDLLHCYGDLSKLVQQFLSSNGPLIQKVKFDSTLNVDFCAHFNQKVCQPMGFCLPTRENVLLDCGGSGVESAVKNTLIVDAGGPRPNGLSETVVSLSEVAIPIYSPKDYELFGTEALMNLNDAINFKTIPLHSENEFLSDQRFVEQFQQIAMPLNKFAQELSLMSTSLIELHKDIVLRRCVVNGNGLLTQLTFCENVWDQLEAHNKNVQLILHQSLSQLWRRDIERVQRQQQAVREKLEEMRQLQRLAQKALKVSQHLKPFAVQMASIISVIDTRRTAPIGQSPMEQICSEISQISTSSESRVAAIDKEEQLRQQKIAIAEKEKNAEAIRARKNLKSRALKLLPHHHHRSLQVLELCRDRGNEKIMGPTGKTAAAASKRNARYDSPTQNSKNACAVIPQNHSENALKQFDKPVVIEDSQIIEEHVENIKERENKNVEEKNVEENKNIEEENNNNNNKLSLQKTEVEAAFSEASTSSPTSPCKNNDKEKVKAATETERRRREEEEEEKKFTREKCQAAETATANEKLAATKTPQISSTDKPKNYHPHGDEQGGKVDPSVLMAREKLLESIKERVKRID